jgi:hypothetical protein
MSVQLFTLVVPAARSGMVKITAALEDAHRRSEFPRLAIFALALWNSAQHRRLARLPSRPGSRGKFQTQNLQQEMLSL